MSMKSKVLTAKMVIVLLFLTVTTAYSEEAREIPKDLGPTGGDAIFDSLRFQSGVHVKSDQSLGDLAKNHSAVKAADTSFGFAATSDEARFFLIGSFYSEALAYVQSGKTDLAIQRLGVIEKEFINLNVPGSLFNYMNKTRNLISTNQYPKDVLIDFLSLFQPFFEDFAKSIDTDRLTLFRAGSWLVDMSLTAAAGDKEFLRQSEKLNYFITEMEKMDAPKGVLKALREIATIAAQKEISDRDAKKILRLSKKIQKILG